MYDVHNIKDLYMQAYGAANQGYAAQADMRSPLHGQANSNQVVHTSLDARCR